MSEQIEGAINQQPFEDWFARIQKTPLNEGVLAEVALAAYRLGYQQGIAPVVAPIVGGSADNTKASEYKRLLNDVRDSFDCGYLKLNDFTDKLYERIERAVTE